MGGSAARAMAALAACGFLAACQGFLPQEDDPMIPAVIAPQVERGGPSGQRLGEDGFPLLGAVPRAAGPQARASTVAQTQARYANVAGRARPVRASGVQLASTASPAARDAEARRRAAEYARTVEELQALARQQQARVQGE